MFKIVKRNEKGFTLIELMIVIAIIGILAAIAIPQFAQYRIRGYNAAAQSDVRNIATSESSFFADWQRFGATQDNVAAVAGGAGAVVIGGIAVRPLISAADNGGTVRELQISLGNNVGVISVTNAAGAALAIDTTFYAISKHTQGNTYFGVDGDVSAVYQDLFDGTDGTALAAGVAGFASSEVDNFALAGNGPSGQPWTVK